MSNYPIFSVLGLEIEYMLVDRDTLNVRPISDVILKELNGLSVFPSLEDPTSQAPRDDEKTIAFDEAILGDIAASNELVLHVLELKNNGPRAVTEPVAEQFQNAILALQPILEKHQIQLLPTGAHPWMDPHKETVRWPHGNREIYQQYDTIFDCRGHGWSNLQSMHVNLPFANDEEFFQLHSAIRILLPLLPALAASTPFLEGKPTGMLDSRLYFYDKNQQRIPSITGEVIPEFVQSPADYQETILTPMYRDISALDPKGLLQYEWLNSRGAIAKFDYNAIEIRIVDSQECVKADIAIAHAIHAILKYWNTQSDFHLKRPCDTQRLKSIYLQTLTEGLSTRIDDSKMLEQWQLPPRTMTANEVLTLLIERVSPSLNQVTQCALEHILHHGNLSQRILKACNNQYDRATLTKIYRQLGDNLLTNQQL